MDNKNIKNIASRFFRSGSRYPMLLLPLILGAALLVLIFAPAEEAGDRNVSLRTLDVPEFPIILVLEQDAGTITSAWLRTPAGARNLERLEGLSFISENAILSKVDSDSKNDLLWNLSFMNFEGDGIHLWIGMTTQPPRVFVTSAPFQYTRWHALPAKVEVPKGTSIYIAPAAPFYRLLDRQYSGVESYSFIYTIMMTPEGPAFVPVPSVYRQLSVLLRAGMHGETSPNKRMAYVRMLTEFNRLAEGKAPQADTLLNFPLEKIETLSWK
ncbi:MAG: hypothetical protein IJM42_04560 [Synergistes sp.]|nr:hypothetical protein [Synergistes sp.]MCR5336856.1 hypothetical protein [Synergistes sp.]